MLKIEYSGQFKKDYKLAVKRGCNPQDLMTVITMLSEQKTLPDKYRDHALENSRNYHNVRECHIKLDWLLIYRVCEDRLVLELLRTGTHSDLF